MLLYVIEFSAKYFSRPNCFALIRKSNFASVSPRTAAMALGLTSCLSAGPGLAQNASDQQAAPPKNAWLVNCTNTQNSQKLRCQMVQTVQDQKSGKIITRAIVRRDDQSSGLSLLLALPHGLNIPFGVHYKVDDQRTARVPIQTSDPNGVYAAFPLHKALLASMKAGNEMKIFLQNVQRKSFNISLSLNGFTASSAKLATLK